MSTPFPKSKEKRPRSSSEPNKSFVKNVTSRVSGLLPATITKWFSSPRSSNTNGSTQVADATDSSTEDEAPESPITIQPPAKKIRYTSPGEFNQHVPVETRCTSTNTESVNETYTTHSPAGRNNSRRENIFASTRVHSANDANSEETAQDTFFKSQHSYSAIENSVVTKRKSLFGTPQDDYYKRARYTNSGNTRDPHFKPSLLSSPFYVGRTTYGGATSSYLTPSSFKKKSISLTNETSNNDSVTMSHSARRIMDLLEHYSSPLIEAKRIPQITREPEIHSPNNSIQQPANPHGPNMYSYKTQELYVPSIASILTIKRKSRLMDTTNAARQIIASHSSSSEFLPYPKTNSIGEESDDVTSDKLTTKIKSRLTRTNRDRNVELENNTSEATVNLPNVVLQIDKNNLPKFTFGPVSTSQPPHSSSIQTPVIITPEALKKTVESDKSDSSKIKNVEKDKQQVKNNNDCYKFSRPVQISSDSNKTSSNLPKFSFGSPVSNIEKVPEVITKDNKLPLKSSDQVVLDNKLTVQKTTDWKCSDCLVMNKIDVNKCVCCGGKKPSEITGDPKKCSVCNMSIKQAHGDKCTECEKKTNNIDNPLVVKETNTIKWKCNDCWVDNNESADKCVCCGGRNPKKTSSTAVTNSEKTVESDWKCNECWIKNNSSLTKCAACGGSKPGTQGITYNSFGNNALAKDSQNDNKIKNNLDNTFKNIAKSQSERWECPLCLVRNESNRETCICCEANKPGTEKESNTKFNFHQPSEITFKFGIQPKTQETLTDFETEECNMAEESETNNNILPKTSTFNFGLSVKKFENLSESADKTTEAPKMNFTFGVPKETQLSPVRNSIFGIPSKSVETNKTTEEKPQEVPQVFTPPQSNEPVKKNLGLFNPSVTSQVAPEMPGLVPLQQSNQNSAIKKDKPFLSTTVIPSTSSEANTPENNFKFPSIMPATNLFAKAPTTTTAMSNIIPAPLTMSVPVSSPISIFQKPNVAATTTTSSFFQNSDSVPSLGVSLFSKTESTTTTTTSAPLGTMQPVFSFGGQGSVPQAEKPKFSFNFTSNKTDSATIFKPTFGVSTDNNISNNNFNLPANTLIGGNALSGSPLNSTTQMNTANALTSGNSLTAPSGSNIFGATVPKENMWSPNTSNIFATNTTTNGDQKPPPAFTFGTSTPFNANNVPFGNTTQQTQPNNVPFGSTAQQAQPNNTPFGSTPQQAQPNNTPFGSTTQQVQSSNAPFGSTPQQAQPNNVPFGSTAQQAQPNNTPFGSTTQQAPSNSAAFGSTTQQPQLSQPPQNVFGIGSQTTASQPPMFRNHLQSQSTPNIFGSLQVPNNPMPLGIFGSPNPVATPSFGTLNPSIPTFETPAQPAPTSFNFGGQPSAACNIFGFGQQQPQPAAPQQPENQPGMYGFGGPAGPAPQMQFTIGSAPNTAGRRVRKAMRRTQR